MPPSIGIKEVATDGKIDRPGEHYMIIIVTFRPTCLAAGRLLASPAQAAFGA